MTFDKAQPRLAVRGARWLCRQATRVGWRKDLDREGIVRGAWPRGAAPPWDDGLAGRALTELLGAFKNDADVNDLGRWLAHRHFINLLRSRADAMQAWQRNPEILSMPVRRPVFVVGLPRTGTTFLYNLLAIDPEARPLLAWESLFPAATSTPGREHSSNGRSRSRLLVGALRRAVPELESIHALRADGPEECTWMMMQTFVTPAFLMAAELRTYRDWLWSLSADEMAPAYTFYRRLLQLLQWRRPGGRWLLKSPAHLPSLGALFTAFPDARVVCLHRDLRQVIPSGCSLFAVTRRQFCDNVSPSALGSTYVDTSAQTLHRASVACAARTDAVCHVRYQDLVDQPLDTVRHIYRFLDETMADDVDSRMTAWLKRDAQSRRRTGVHRYSLAQFGLNEEMLARAFGEQVLRDEAGASRS